MNKGRVELKISVPKHKLDPNNTHWDEETFNLSEHLLELSKHYGIEQIKETLTDCEWVINKLKK